MFIDGLDMLGSTLRHKQQIESFARNWHGAHPWLKDVAAVTRDRLNRTANARI
ncbi:hypothetical protein HHL21_20825 [Massilia sp. RP-1-19]|uniref:Uncharacterized protein n=1 Tax=Massilia polaris TaxID=2728846 RepID=A0A848HNH7_9BURK|nr:hypothetical protein [Massilia polaris]NML63486.1 hypothetical protein [Massilia polaris]